LLARDRSEDFQLLLARYGLEGLLYRLSQSRHRDRFVLKLAVVMKWSQTYRPRHHFLLGDTIP
jgi:hypothetical protein